MIKRRRFLQGLALSACLPMLPNLARADDHWDVIVIGAGVSGLAAAAQLRKKDYKVVVVEARQRLGGRLWSDTSLGFPLDLGASWIEESRGNPLTALCQGFGIHTIVDPDEWQYLRPDGKPLSQGAEKRMAELQSWLVAESLKHKDMSQRQAAETILRERSLGDEERLLLREFYHGNATEFGALPEDCSVLAHRDGGFEPPSRLFPGGYAQVAQHLARGLTVRLGQVVKRVAWSKTGVEVGLGNTSLRARCAIVTLPLGVLQSGAVAFEPALPEAQKLALSSLKMGLLNKVVVTYPKALWPTKWQHFANLSEDTGVLGEILNLQALFHKPGLLLFLAGRPAWEREKWPDSRLRQEVESLLGRLFGVRSPSQGWRASRWGSDPFSRGSYSYLPVGVDPKMRASLAHPQPPLFFAGEATHKNMSATVHGAYLSGLRAARELDEAWD